MTEGANVSRNASLAAHELGHLLFGTGDQKPKGWDDGFHSKNPDDLMRDTEAKGEGTGGPLRGDEKLSQDELCKLADKVGLKAGDCCTYKDKVKDTASNEFVLIPGEVGPELTQL
jgi:hypothetical protein